jgi:hypothetical protein
MYVNYTSTFQKNQINLTFKSLPNFYLQSQLQILSLEVRGVSKETLEREGTPTSPPQALVSNTEQT